MINLLNSKLIESPDYIRLPLIQYRVLEAGTLCDGICYWSQFAKKYIERTVLPRKETFIGESLPLGCVSFNVRTQERSKLLQNRWWWSVQEK